MLSVMKGTETATGRMQRATAVIGIPVGVVLGLYTLQEPIPSLISVSISRSAFDSSVGFVRLVFLHRRFTFLASAGRSSRGGDPRTDQITQGTDSELPGWQPKEKAS